MVEPVLSTWPDSLSFLSSARLLLVHMRADSSAMSDVQPHPEYLAMRNKAFSLGLLPNDFEEGLSATQCEISEYNKSFPFFPKNTDRLRDAVPVPEVSLWLL